MAGGERTVKVKFTGDAKGVTAASDDAASSIDKFQHRLNLATAGILAGAAAIGVGLVKIGGQFDAAFDTIQTKTGAVGAQLDQLKGDFNAALKDSVGTTQQTAEALAGLAQRTNLTGPPLQKLTKQLVDLNHLTGLDIPTAVNDLTRVFGDWSIATDQQSEALDKLFRASQATGTNIDTIAQQVVAFGAPLRQLGFTFDESITLIGKWNKEGVNTELVLGGLKKALGVFSKAGEDPVKALDTLIDRLKRATSTAQANQIAIEVLGVKAGPDFAAAVREGRFDYQAMLDTVQKGQSTIENTTDATADWEESLQKLENDGLLAIQPTAITFFNMLDTYGIPILQGLFDWTQKNPAAANALGLAILGLAGSVVLANAAWKLYNGWLVISTASMWAARTASLALAIALDANPLFLIITALGLIVLGIGVLMQAGVDFGKVWDAVWSTAKSWVIEAGLWIAGFIGDLRRTFAAVRDIILTPFKAAFNAVADIWNGTIGTIGFTVPDWVPGVGGKSFHVPKISHWLAEGGPAMSGGAYWVGERGPEPFFPAENGRVLSSAEAKSALAGGGSGGGDTYFLVQIGDEPIRTIVRAEKVEADRDTRRWVTASSGATA